MLIPLLLVISASSSTPSDLSEPSTPPVQPMQSAAVDNLDQPAPPTKWTYSFPQFLAGVGGSALGGLTGAAIGGFFGILFWSSNGEEYKPDCNTVCTPDAGTEIETGARIGAMVGGVFGITKAVVSASPKAYPTSKPLATFTGALLGGGAGWLATWSMLEPDGGYTWPRWGILAATSSLGAVLADRKWTSTSPVVVAPWTPRTGMKGAVVSLRF